MTTSTAPGHHPDQLRHAYADGRDLEQRRSIYQYRNPALDLPAEAEALLADAAGPVLDVGTGTGAFARRLRAARPDRPVVALDLSPTMVGTAGAPGVIADAGALPLGDATVGAALAMHMLYHVADPAVAVAELRRVVRPGGTVLISANATGDKRELYGARDAAESDVTGQPPIWRSDTVDGRCTLDRAEELAGKHFDEVKRLDFTGTVVVPAPEPVVAFCHSLRAWYAGDRFEEILAAVRARVAAEIARSGAFRVTAHTGILACR